MLANRQIFIATPYNANGIGFDQHHRYEDQQDDNAQALRAQLQQFIAPRQTMAVGDDAVNGSQVAQVASCAQSGIFIIE